MTQSATQDGGTKKRRSSVPGFMPIKSLKNFMSKFKIQGRVVEKSGLNTFQGRQGPGKVFSCVLVDNESTAINAKFWNDSADEWYEKLEKGKVYSFYKGRIQLSNKRFAGTVEHDYEIHFDKDSEIHEIENTEDIPTARVVQYASLRSVNMSTKALPFLTNILAVVHSYQQSRSMQSKSNPSETRQRRVIVVVDATRHALDVTLWGDLCNVSETLLDTHPVVSLVNLQIREWNGKAASTLSTTEVEWEPKIKAAAELKQWYEEHAAEEGFQSLSTGAGGTSGAALRPIKDTTLKEMHQDMETVTEVDDIRMYRVHSYITRLLYRNMRQDNQFICVYPRCSKCGRKLTEGSNMCCAPEPVEVQNGLTFGCLLADASCSGLRVTFFHDQAQALLGVSGTKVAEWVAASGSEHMHPEMKDLFEEIIPWKRYTLTIRAKRDNYRNQFRTNFSVTSAVPYTPGAVAAHCMAECLKLIANIFDGANCKRILRSFEEEKAGVESGDQENDIAEADVIPKRKIQCLDSPGGKGTAIDDQKHRPSEVTQSTQAPLSAPAEAEMEDSASMVKPTPLVENVQEKRIDVTSQEP